MTGRWGAPLVLAGALAGFLLARQPWWQVAGAGGLSGSLDGGGAASGLPLAVGAALLLSLTLPARGRRLLAVLTLLLGLGMLVVGVRPPRPGDARVSAVTHLEAASAQASQTTWPWGYAAAALLVALGSLLMLARRAVPRTTLGPAPTPDVNDPASLWKALDAGEDPTDTSTDHA